MRVATATATTPTIVFHVTHRIKRYPDCATTVKAGKMNFLFEFYTIEKRICNIIVNRSCYIIAAAMVILIHKVASLKSENLLCPILK